MEPKEGSWERLYQKSRLTYSDEEHDVDTVKGWKTNILKDPRKEVTILEAQQEDFQGPCGVHIEEITHLEDMQE